jgi:hypothetical protein
MGPALESSAGKIRRVDVQAADQALVDHRTGAYERREGRR